jgi:acetoin utilization protein AcuB
MIVNEVTDTDEEGVMLVRDVMSTNVVSVPSTKPLTEARRIMEAHKIRHLPVVDKGKLVGLVSRDSLDKAGPSKLTTFSMHEISYLLSKLTVAEVMKRELVTVPPTATVEEAVALARRRRVDSLLVVEEHHLVGIATSNDFFDKVANPILGIDKPGVRLAVHGCCRKAADLQKIMGIISRFEADVISVATVVQPETGRQDLIIHLDLPDSAAIIDGLRAGGYHAHERAR